MYNRPPIGFVVEGHDEYNCYPSLLCKSVGVKGFSMPRVNAGSCGSILKRLDEHLTDLCITWNPLHIIVTIDLIDAIRSGIYANCDSLRQSLSEQANNWLHCTPKDNRVTNQPESISIVIQIQKFEAWIIADVKNLRKNNFLADNVPDISDVDNVPDPASWLKTNLLIRKNIKNPNFAKELISILDPKLMRNNSKSFNKFYREVNRKYKDWKGRCNSV